MSFFPLDRLHDSIPWHGRETWILHITTMQPPQLVIASKRMQESTMCPHHRLELSGNDGFICTLPFIESPRVGYEMIIFF